MIARGAEIVEEAHFERAYPAIFNGQIRALQQLNGRPLPLAQLRQFYDVDVAAAQDHLRNYPFEDWLAYLVTMEFIANDGATVQVAARGRDFLKWMINAGKWRASGY
jgi:hypothetical protein